MPWFLAYPNCIDYTKVFQTEEEGIAYLKSLPLSKNLSLYSMDYGFSELDGKGDDDEDEAPSESW